MEFRLYFMNGPRMITSLEQNVAEIKNIGLTIGNLSFENLEKFKYLVVTVTNTNDIHEESKRRKTQEMHCVIRLK